MTTTKNKYNLNFKVRPEKNSPEKVAETLLKADGSLNAAAARLGVTRQGVYEIHRLLWTPGFPRPGSREPYQNK